MPTVSNTPPARAVRAALAAALLAAAAQAGAAEAADWRSCAALAADAGARLACFDQWARQQATDTLAAPAAPPTGQAGEVFDAAPASTPNPAQGLTMAQPLALPDEAQATQEVREALAATSPPGDGCRNGSNTTLSRYWELERSSDCGSLRFRGYRPLSVSVVHANRVNRQPTSANPLNNAGTPVDYRTTEMRVQLSVRTKLAKGLLAEGESLDSLWVGYTQQSYWQLFSPDISRPFRNTDHEPEVVYVYPTTANLPWGWRWRYSGVGLVHQSNGQSRPLSRSWNRVYLMTGVELQDRWALTARVWRRLSESAANDDNPGISDYVGRAELGAIWNVTGDDTLGMTLRNNLRRSGRGSLRLEWLHSLGNGSFGAHSNLRLHAMVFTGYGDSLVDYNRKRTVFSLGLSLVDF